MATIKPGKEKRRTGGWNLLKRIKVVNAGISVNDDKMKIKLTLGAVIAFIALLFLMHEAHEMVHTAVGRMICGCWGQRDFNVWSLCEGCMEKYPVAVWATFAGPLFTFTMIWMGVYFLSSANTAWRSLGFALIFANIPFARIFTAAMDKGDEVYGLNRLLHQHQLSWVLGLTIVLLFTAYPLWKVYKAINNKNRVGYFILFLLSPMMLDMIIVFGLMNTLLRNGVLSSDWILGAPVIVTLFTGTMLVIFISTAKYIFRLAGK